MSWRGVPRVASRNVDKRRAANRWNPALNDGRFAKSRSTDPCSMRCHVQHALYPVMARWQRDKEPGLFAPAFCAFASMCLVFTRHGFHTPRSA
jgi:hypothetical protein